MAKRGNTTVFIEVKARPTLAEAAYALRPRQQARFLAAGEIALAKNPSWASEDIRFDVMLIDAAGTIDHIEDAVRIT